MPFETFWPCFVLAASLCGPSGPEGEAGEADADSAETLGALPVWRRGPGRGFEPWTLRAGFALGGGPGFLTFGGREPHDLLFGNLQFGAVVTPPVGGDSPFRGNVELAAEAFGAYQVEPDPAGLGGLSGIFRYDFATGARWVPFADGGFGVAATNIRGVDLSTTFQFAVQAGGGFHFFLSDRVALTAQYRWIHVSNADIEKPNNGVNTHLILVGLSWFFGGR
ncbi:MAG: acyloxyacyl hydrolase [Planctomycetota bacterium]